MAERPLLLDTCAALWLVAGQLRASATEAIRQAINEQREVLVSPITAWEVGMLKTKGRIALAMPVEAWFDALLASGVACADLSPQVLIAAAELDAPGLRDPGDRIITATARAYHATILTRDRPILEFAAAGHALAIAC